MTVAKLNDIAEIRGRVGWRGYSVDDLRDSGPLVIGANDITEDNQLSLKDAKHLSREKYEESPDIFINKGDILVVKVGNTIGKVCIIEEDIGEACINPNCVIVRPTKVHPQYLYYYMCSPPGRAFLINNSTASGQPALNQTTLKKMDIPLVDDVMQKKMIQPMVSLNKKIKINNSIISELESMAKDIYDYWFVQFDFPDENGKPYKSSGGKMVWNEELKREIPEGWSIGNLYNIAEFHNGLACQKYRPTDDNHKLPVIKIGEMHNGFRADTEWARDDIPTKNLIENGDILFSWSATLEVMLWKNGRGVLNQHIFKVVPNEKYAKYYVFQQLSAYVGVFVKMAEARKTTMGHITTDHLNQSRIMLPPSSITSKYDERVSALFDLILTCSEENNNLASLRDWLLPMLMNGQIMVGGAE